MTQRLIVRLIPLEAFVVAVLLGYLLVSLQLVGPVADNPVVEIAAPAPAAATGALSPVFTPEVRRWESQILAWSQAFALDPNLVATVMQIESCGSPSAVSSAGARGLFQVMPFHFTTGEDMLDPETNAARGLAYLAGGLQAAGGQAGLALAGYNGGHSQIGRDSSLWPSETQRYYYWGTGIYQDASSGATESPRLAEWLAAGGSSLCARAAQEVVAR
jgi:soluble lytic murein transglycosylase-like protein